MTPWISAVLAVFLALAISSGDAVKCFVCNSNQDYACLDPFNYAHLPLMDCDRISSHSQTYQGQRSVCKKTKQRLNGGVVVDRSCAWEQNYGADPCYHGSQNYGYDGYTEHCSVCRYDSCNGAGNLAPAYWALAASIIGYFAVKCF